MKGPEARAQQAGKLPIVGFLGAVTLSAWSPRVAACAATTWRKSRNDFNASRRECLNSVPNRGRILRAQASCNCIERGTV